MSQVPEIYFPRIIKNKSLQSEAVGFFVPETRIFFLREKKGAAAMKKEIAAIYCRLSVEDKEKEAAESESIQNQRALLLEYAKKQD